MTYATLQTALEDWSRPALLPGAETADIEAFVREHGEHRVQERTGRLPIDFRYCRLAELYTEARTTRPGWRIRFTQRAGEIAYVPRSWCHAVRNEDWHLAVIHELAARVVRA